jgi:hypothetical protein
MGGDLLYRWGNPRTYRAGDSTDQVFYHQHNTAWIKPGLPGVGNITVLDNGQKRPGTLYSTAIEFTPPVDSTGHYETPAPGQPYGPAGPVWQYIATPPASFYSTQLGSVQRLPNGHTLICEGNKGRFFEVGPDSQVVWTYISPLIDTVPLYQGTPVPGGGANAVHRSPRYAPDYPGLAGRTLTPGYPVELYSTRQMVAVAETHPGELSAFRPSSWPNPFVRQSRISFGTRYPGSSEADIFGVDGRLVRTLTLTGGSAAWDGADNSGQQVSRGIYCCRLRGYESGRALKLVKLD